MIHNFTIAGRVILGFLFLFSGLNAFLHFMPMPPISPKGMAFLQAMLNTGYLFPLIKSLEIGCGLLMVVGVLVPLALVVIAPIVVNIILFHVFLDSKGMGVIFGIALLYGFLVWAYRKHFRSLF